MSLIEVPATSDREFGVSEAFTVNDQRSMSPDVAVALDGSVWVVWSQQDSELGEQILVRQFEEAYAGPIHPVGTQTGIEFQPCITNLAHGSLRVFWIAHRDGMWRLMTRSFRNEAFADESCVAMSADGLFNPRAAIDATGNCWVVCEKVVGQRTRLATFRQAKDAWIELPLETLEGHCYRPDVCLGPNRTLWVSYDEYSGGNGKPGNYRVALQPVPGSAPPEESLEPETPENTERQTTGMDDTTGRSASNVAPIVIADSGYQNVHSSLASDAIGNLWIALASNQNDARRDPAWLTKWSYLYHFDGTSVSQPAAPRPDVDLYNEHAYQGWEFPAVGTDQSGNVLLVGQSAHSILAQSFCGSRWSEVHTLTEPKWGSWKPRCRIAGSGPHFVVSMTPAGATLQQIDFGSGTVSEAPIEAALVPRINPLSAITRKETRMRASEESRPFITTRDGERLEVFFGDLHAHSAFSDAVGDVDEFYNRYRDHYGYDFAALTDHDYLDGIELSRSELKMIWNHADRFSSDNEFLAWYAYEWTSPAIAVHAAEGSAVGEGHRHVLYPDQTGPLVSYGDPESNTGAKLLEKLKDVRALVIPHHTSWSGTDWDAHDPELQRLVEIVSTHGRFEYPGNKPIGYRRDHIHTEKTVLAALNRGYRLGFVGGSDSHGLRWHAIELEGRAQHIPEGTRVGWKEDAYRTGMTAIFATELTREGLFAALRERRCYATSGVPIYLDFRVNGEIMGSEITVNDQPTITASVVGTGAIRSAEIVRSSQVFGGLQMQPGEGIATINFTLEDTMLIPGESAYYYLRVVQEDGNMAWSTPIWVSYA